MSSKVVNLIYVVYYREQTLFLSAQKFFLLFFLFDLLNSHGSISLHLGLKVVVYLFHLLGRRVELECNDPRRPLRSDPVDKLKEGDQNDFNERVKKIVDVPPWGVKKVVTNCRESYQSHKNK